MRITKKGFEYDQGRFENGIDEEYGVEVFKKAYEYNYEMINAFARSLRRGGVPLEEIEEKVRYLYWFVDRLNSDSQDVLVWDHLGCIEIYWEDIMNRIILKTSDINEGILRGITRSVMELYEFIQKKGILDDISELKNIDEKTPDLVKRMEKYNKVRHDSRMSEDKKEEIRSELFGDCYFLPFD